MLAGVICARFLNALRQSIKVRNWITSAQYLHSINNFIDSGSEETGTILSAPVSGFWPTASISQTSKGLRAFEEYLRYGYEYLTKLNECNDPRIALEHAILRVSSPTLKLSLNQKNIPLSALVPSARLLVQLFSSHKEANLLHRLENFKRVGLGEIFNCIDNLQYGNFRGNSTIPDYLKLKDNVDVVRFTNQFNHYCLTNNVAPYIDELYTSFNNTSLFPEDVEHFIKFLNSILNSDEELATVISEAPRLSEYEIEPEPIPLPKDKHLNTIIEAAETWVSKDILVDLTEYLYEAMNLRLRNLLQGCIQRAGFHMKSSYAILGCASWGRNTALPYSEIKLIIVTEFSSTKVAQEVSNFIQELSYQCEQVGFPRPNEPIQYGDPVELFRSFVNVPGDAPKLMKLCEIWDTSFIGGNHHLGRQFKHTVSAIVQAKSQLIFQPRAQQFVQSMMQQVKHQVQKYNAEIVQREDSKNVVDTRQLCIVLAKVLNFLSLYYDVTSETVWERATKLHQTTSISKSIYLQIVAISNLAHYYFLRAQLYYRNNSGMVYQKNSSNTGSAEQGKFIVQNFDHWDMLQYGVYTLLPKLGDLLFLFAYWLEDPKGENPLLGTLKSSDLADLYHHQAGYYYKDDHLDWNQVYENCQNFMELCEPAQVTYIRKQLQESEIAYDQEGYFFSILEDSLRSMGHALNIPDWDFVKQSNPFLGLIPNGYISICREMIPRVIDQLTDLSRALQSRNLHDCIPELEEHIRTLCDTTTEIRTSKLLIISLAHFIVVLHIWPDREFSRSTISSLCAQLLVPNVANPEHLGLILNCVSQLVPVLNSSLACYDISTNPWLITQVQNSMQNNRGLRVSSAIKQNELNQILLDMSTPKVRSVVKGKGKNLNDEIEIQWVRNSLQYEPPGEDIDPSQEQVYKQYLKPEIVQYIFPKKRMVFDPDHPCRVTEGNRFVIPLKVGSKSVHIKAYPELPGVHVAIDSLFRRISGNSASATLTRFYRGKTDNAHPVLVSKTIPGRSLFTWMQRRDNMVTLEASLCPIAFTFKVLETLLINPEDDKPDNFIVEPFTSAAGKTLYRIISIDTDHAFAVPILRDKTTGKETVNVKTAIFCLNKMKETLNEEAVLTFLQLDPFETLLDWLKCLAEYQAYITGSKYTTALFSKDEQMENLKSGFSLRGLIKKKEKEETACVVPLDFHPKLIAALYRRFVNLQEVLRKDMQQPSPELTHIKLVSLIEPRLASFYANLLSTHETAAERWEALPTNYVKIPPAVTVQPLRRDSLPTPMRAEPEEAVSLSRTITIGYGNYSTLR